MSILADKVTEAWYNKRLWVLLLLPLSVIFWLIAIVRKLFYRAGVLQSVDVDVPVIVIGNITVGGTGKSPLTALLVEALTARGFRPGIVSRGYGGESKEYPLLVDERSQSNVVGDEPLMLWQMSGVPVVVDPLRSRAANYLTDHCKVDVVICDDGLQHYALSRDIEICVIDGQRGVGNGFMLPAGPLREPVSRIKSVDFVISNGTSDRVSQFINTSNSFEMTLESADLINVYTGEAMSLAGLKGGQFHAVAGIGNPSRFFKALAGLGAEVTTHSFPDHHQYSVEDLAFDDERGVVMTQKDAVKCRELYKKAHVSLGDLSQVETAPKNIWFLPVKAVIDDDFVDALCEKIKH